MSKKMDWNKLLVQDRFKYENDSKKSDDGRSQFQKDIDRITFSGSFRRLGRKTQVHPLNENDHIHTRLSHSLEVACVGRSLGVMVGNYVKEIGELPDNISPLNLGEIVQAACLAHDIGNPPFGHAGEEVIRMWFERAFIENEHFKNTLLRSINKDDFKYFDGNAMAFRVVVSKEYFTNDGGMRLTLPTLGAMLKYPWTSHFAGEKKKFSCFQSEYSWLVEIAEKLGLVISENIASEKKCKFYRHPLAFLVEAADDICYRILDIEDAIELGILRPHYMRDSFLKLLELKNQEKEFINSNSVSNRSKNAFLRGKTMELLINDIVKTFKSKYDEIMNGEFDEAITETQMDSFEALNNAYKRVKKEVYTNKRKIILEIGAFSTLGNLLSTFTEAAFQICYEQEALSYKSVKIKELLGSNMPKDDIIQNGDHSESYYIMLMHIIDYLTGMTDHYATDINRKILGLGM